MNYKDCNRVLLKSDFPLDFLEIAETTHIAKEIYRNMRRINKPPFLHNV